MKKPLLRTRFIVNPRLQYMFAGMAAFISIGNLLFFVLASALLEKKVHEEIQSLDPEAKKFALIFIESVFNPLVQGVVVFNIFTILISFVLGAILLNHIAGPIYAITRQITQFLAGEPRRHPIKLRKHDFFKELSDAVNQLLEKVEKDTKTDSKDPS